MAATLIGFKPTPKDEAQVARLREQLQRREPYRRISISDTLRFALYSTTACDVHGPAHPAEQHQRDMIK